MSSALVVVGSINADQTLIVPALPRPGETILASTSLRGLGGKGANQAVAAAAYTTDISVALIGCVGNDESGRLCLTALQESGVRSSDVRQTSAPTGAAWIAVDEHGENSIIVLPGANLRIAASNVLPVLDRIAGEHRTLTILCQGEIDPSVVDAVAHWTSRTGARFILNLAPVIAVDEATLTAADPLVVNLGEFQRVCRRLEIAAEGDLASAVLDTARRLGTRLVVTLGGDGVIYTHADRVRLASAQQVSRVVDTTGAGDAFVGTLAAALAGGSYLPDAVDAGVAAGAEAVTRRGASVPSPSASPAASGVA